MDRIALSKRLEGLSEVFASTTNISRDLKAMAHVLANLPEEKFAKVLNPEYKSDEVDAAIMVVGPGAGPKAMGGPGGMTLPGAGIMVPGTEGEGECPMKGKGKGIGKALGQIKDIIKKEEEEAMSMEANQKTAGVYWNKEASTAVAQNLLRDVLGMEKATIFDTHRHLTPVQVPDGKKPDEKPAQLKDAQTPDIAPVIKSDMYAKSKGAVRKEATEADKDAGQNADQNASKNIPKNVDAIIAKTEGLPKKASEEAPKVEAAKVDDKAAAKKEEKKSEEKKEDKKPEEKKEDKKDKESCKDAEASKEASSFTVEGIEMVPTMEEVVLSKDEEAKLAQLF